MFEKKTLSNTISAISAAGLSAALASSPAFAEEASQQVTELKKVQVSATRVEQDADDVNRSIAVVSKEKLEEIQANSVAEAVSFQTNVTVAGGAVPGNQKVNIRGLTGSQVLQVIDGARSNTNFSHRPSFFLEPEFLKSVEVLKGPSSSIWGSGAIGGVVVQNTIDSEDVIKEGKNSGAFVKQGYQDNGDVFTTSAAIASKNETLDTVFAVSHRKSNAMEQGNGYTLHGTEADNLSILAKLGGNIDQHQRLEGQIRHSDQEGHPPTVGSADDALNSADDLIDRNVEDSHFALDYSHKGSSNLLNLDAKLYYNDTENEEINNFGGNDRSDVETIGFNVLNNFDLGKTQILAGIDGYSDTIETSRAVNVNDPSGNRPNPPSKAESDAWGVFTTITHDLTNTVQLEASLRYDDFETESKDLNSSSSEDNLSTSAGIRWQATDWMRWTLRYDEAFRAPTAYELYIQGTHFNYGAPGWDNSFVANPDLAPEKAENIELKLDLAFNNLIAKDSLNISAAAFQNDVEDFIYLDVDTNAEFGPPPACNCVTGTSTHKNARDAELWGYEIEALYQVGAFNALLSYGQTRGTHKTTVSTGTTQDHLRSMPADKWVADFSYGFWNIDTKLGSRILAAEKQDRVEEGESTYDNYTLVDFYATWEPSSVALEGLKVDLVVANAFDQNYQQAWSEVAEPGRSARIAAQYSF